MTAESPFELPLPPAANPAVAIVTALTAAGHEAVLAGGCVRDLLLGQVPHDYDVATDAPPERICELFPKTRKVGMQFGVVLVKKQRRWHEVATYRSDGPYDDGRRPTSVTLSDARHDALRRDFTVNGMFLDPARRLVIDYVGGRADLDARIIRAIGNPDERFAEDHLRLLRAVRFAARLAFPIEPQTLAAIRKHAAALRRVAPERVLDELERMLSAPQRMAAWNLLGDCGLRDHLWPDVAWAPTEVDRIERHLPRLAPAAEFTTVLAVLLAERDPGEIARIARAAKWSNEQQGVVAWLVAHQADLDDPQAPTLADLKRLMAHPAFLALVELTRVRHADLADGTARDAALRTRTSAIAPDQVAPPPLVTGNDLLERGLAPGPLFKNVLDTLYTEQLDERLTARTAALTRLTTLLAERDATSSDGDP
jgi:poly(A) polymerase